MSRYLVTGGGGFIGSNLVEALLRRGEDVRALDDFSSGRRQNLARADSWGGSFELMEADLRDENVCRQATADRDFVIHHAAIPSVQRSVADPLRTNEVNISGTLRLLQAAREAGVQRFVFASSSSLYGESETLPKHEGMPRAPISPYGLQKMAAESYCGLFTRMYGVRTVALRYFNVFGPRQDPHSEYSAVIPRFITAAKQGVPARIYGDGEQTRDFTFIENVVSANLLACSSGEQAWGQTFNIACGERISLNRLWATITDVVGQDPGVEYLDPRPGDIRHSLAAIERASDALGYRVLVPLEEGLRRTIEAY